MLTMLGHRSNFRIKLDAFVSVLCFQLKATIFLHNNHHCHNACRLSMSIMYLNLRELLRLRQGYERFYGLKGRETNVLELPAA